MLRIALLATIAFACPCSFASSHEALQKAVGVYKLETRTFTREGVVLSNAAKGEIWLLVTPRTVYSIQSTNISKLSIVASDQKGSHWIAMCRGPLDNLQRGSVQFIGRDDSVTRRCRYSDFKQRDCSDESRFRALGEVPHDLVVCLSKLYTTKHFEMASELLQYLKDDVPACCQTQQCGNTYACRGFGIQWENPRGQNRADNLDRLGIGNLRW